LSAKLRSFVLIIIMHRLLESRRPGCSSTRRRRTTGSTNSAARRATTRRRHALPLPPAAAAAAADADTPTPPSSSSSSSSWSYVSPIHRVRDYELDAFQVVNNGVYAHLFQDARHLALEALAGRSVADFLSAGVLMALSELIIRYKAPLRSGDYYVSRVAVADVRGTRVTLRQEVAAVDRATGAELALAAEGSATVVFLNEQYRPARMPAETRKAFEEAMPKDNNGVGGEVL
jgi:acyl-CoA thioesterase FadM